MGKVLRLLTCALGAALWSGAAHAYWDDDCAVRARSYGAILVNYDEMAAHRLVGAQPYRTGRLGSEIFGQVEACVLIGADGHVHAILKIFADGSTGPVAHDAALSLLGARYKPFLRDGKPVRAALLDSVIILPLERRPKTAPPMPALRDPSSVSMTLTRSACFGNCAAYTVELAGDGGVWFNGERFVVLPGEHRAAVSPSAVRVLFERFRKADFFRLYDTYRTNITDSATYVLTLRFDGHVKTVVDYVGESAGMPHVVVELENAVDGVAGTQRWITFGKDTIETLKREKYDFRAHPELLGSVAREGDAQAVRALIGLGVATDGWDACDALSLAAAQGKSEIVDVLLGAGVPLVFGGGGPFRERCNPLAEAAQEGSLAVVRAILARHPPRDVLDDALLRAASGSEAGPVGTVPLLLAAGANLEARDGQDGRTPLMHANRNAALVRVLLAAGAKADARDKDGNNALVNCMDADVAHLLLEAGTDPWAQDKQGHAVVEGTFNECRMAVREWMAAHPHRKDGP